MLTRILGWIAVGITLLYSTVGLFSQIFENWRRGTTEGFSEELGILLFLTFLSWLLYGLAKKDTFIIIANGPGALAASVLLLQIIFY